jgi:hypothetical protein
VRPASSRSPFQKVKVKPSSKGAKTNEKVIGSQANFATTATVFDRMQQIAPEEAQKSPEAALANLREHLHRLLLEAYRRAAPHGGHDNLRVFLRLLARSLAGQLVVRAVAADAKLRSDVAALAPVP